jgi:hypothetical protein
MKVGVLPAVNDGASRRFLVRPVARPRRCSNQRLIKVMVAKLKTLHSRAAPPPYQK